MPDKKLTDVPENNVGKTSDNEIVNDVEQVTMALEYCVEGDCEKCPYAEQTACNEYLKCDAVKVIDRLQAENEKLNTFAEIKKEEIAKLITKTKAEAYKEVLPLLENFRNEVVDKFIIMCDGNDYNKLNLMSMVDTIDCIYDKHCDNLLKELVGADGQT